MIKIINKNVTECYGIKTAPNAMCCWKLANEGLEFTADVHFGGTGVILNGRTVVASEIVQKECIPKNGKVNLAFMNINGKIIDY